MKLERFLVTLLYIFPGSDSSLLLFQLGIPQSLEFLLAHVVSAAISLVLDGCPNHWQFQMQPASVMIQIIAIEVLF